MLSVRARLLLVLIPVLAATPAIAGRYHRAPTSGHTKTATKKKTTVSKPAHQRQIDPERATEIQQALIHENYLSGVPTGQWDAQTEAAMQKYQSDHGWQTKLMPDSRALIKLGLGPSHADALPSNAQTQNNAPTTGMSSVSSLASVSSISQ